MIRLASLLVLFIYSVTNCFSQQSPPTLNTTSFIISIKDGAELKAGSWRVNPKLKKDIYYTSTVNDTVSFISNIDTLSFYIEPLKAYKFYIHTQHGDKVLTIIKQIDLTKIVLPLEYLYEKDSLFNIDLKQNSEAERYPENQYENGKIILTTLYLKVLKNETNEIIWENYYVNISELQPVVDLPTSLLNNPNNYSLFIETIYEQNEKMKHIGLGGWRTKKLKGSHLIRDIPFSFLIESQPKNAELFYMDLKTWNIYEKKLKMIIDLEKTYEVNQLSNGTETINYLKSNYSNPRGYPTPTNIYIIDTPYIVFILENNKIKASKIIPNRNVPQMNRKIIILE